jgi:Zn-dependent M28 family amino/carboxypeptidase
MAIDDDRTSNTTAIEIVMPGNLYYLESRNILVKFDGKQDNLPAVLLSAHYDSNAVALGGYKDWAVVSDSYMSSGATDNSMAVVTLLQLAQYFALHQPTRTIILNFNNGEEDGLHGARLYVPVIESS